MITEDLTHEIVIEDVDTNDADDIACVLEEARDAASTARADVDIEILRAEDGIVVLEVSGHFDDMGPFLRAWEDYS